jgi:serine protease Do
MADLSKTRLPRLTRGRAAAAAFGLGATLALTPMVWAENPTAASPAAPQTMTSPVALIQQQSFAPLVKKVLPAVVNISVTQKGEADQMADEQDQGGPFQGFPNSPFDEMLRRFFDQQNPGGGHAFPQMPDGQARRIALGSGFIVDPSGYVVTNNHVVGDAAKVQVILQDKTKYTARIVGRDPKTDLAVLKIKADQPLPYVTFGDSNAAQVGDWVMAVGNPFGLGGTVTTGIISARGRDINEGPYDDFLQIDAPINRGNSGGPTFNLNGQVIGINTAIYSPNGGSVGIGFAVPSNVAKSIVAQLEEHGKINRGWLGVQIQELTPAIAASLVAAVAPNTPATVAVWRNGREIELQAKLGELPDNNQVASANSGPVEEGSAQATALGMRFAPLTNELRQELHVAKSVDGVVVTRVENGSAAEDVGLAQGDVVVAINQQPVHTPQEAAARLNEAVHSPKKTVLLLLNRHGVTEYVGMSLGANQG